MQIQTQFSYEKTWSDTNEKDLLLIIEKEIGDADPKGTLEYIKEVTAKDKVITVGSCKFRKKQG